jgi:hypothetical protein
MEPELGQGSAPYLTTRRCTHPTRNPTFRQVAAASARSLVLIDEAEARRTVHDIALRVRGWLGILFGAYRKDLIDADPLRLALAEIVRRQHIWNTPALAERLLHKVLGKEKPAFRPPRSSAPHRHSPGAPHLHGGQGVSSAARRLLP